MPDFIIPDWPAPSRVKALTTTRYGGHGHGAYASFNLATHVGDDPLAVAANRQLLRNHLPVAPCWLTQVHGTRCIDADVIAQDVTADACVSRNPARACAVLTADCLPLLLCDEAGSVVAAVHAGWRGLAAGVIETAVAAMAVAPSSLLAWLGPAIGPAAFEVGADVRDVFLGQDSAASGAFVPHGPKTWLCDLYALAARRLAFSGVERISGGGFCTHAEPERFFSHRRDGVSGRMATVVWIEP